LGDVTVYPSQLLLSAAMLLLFIVLWRIDRRLPPSGVLLGLYLFGQGVARYLVDFTRYYEPVDSVRTLGPWIEAKSQIVALVLALAGLLLVVFRLLHHRRASLGADR
jgi:phosphatidylglycerol:prolipoprotein diacylglycerol transferase